MKMTVGVGPRISDHFTRTILFTALPSSDDHVTLSGRYRLEDMTFRQVACLTGAGMCLGNLLDHHEMPVPGHECS
jgi:hypothetical protein